MVAEVAENLGFLIVEDNGRVVVANASFVDARDLHSLCSANQLPTWPDIVDYDHFLAELDPVSAASRAIIPHLENLGSLDLDLPVHLLATLAPIHLCHL